jgi:hypothetical protein
MMKSMMEVMVMLLLMACMVAMTMTLWSPRRHALEWRTQSLREAHLHWLRIMLRRRHNIIPA